MGRASFVKDRSRVVFSSEPNILFGVGLTVIRSSVRFLALTFNRRTTGDGTGGVATCVVGGSTGPPGAQLASRAANVFTGVPVRPRVVQGAVPGPVMGVRGDVV